MNSENFLSTPYCVQRFNKKIAFDRLYGVHGLTKGYLLLYLRVQFLLAWCAFCKTTFTRMESLLSLEDGVLLIWKNESEFIRKKISRNIFTVAN